MTTTSPKAEQGNRLRNWKYVLATTNPPKGRMDLVSKWLYLTRAGVLPMTLVAAAVAGLLAVYRDESIAWGWFALAAAGIVLAHMSNNLMNDLFDLEVGTDREDYPRNLYSPHPVLSGVITRKGLALCALVVNVICLAIMIVLTVERGLADRRIRARRVRAVGRVHRAAVAVEEARPRRTHGARGLGPADGRRHVLRGDGSHPGRGPDRVVAVRAAVHDRPHGQAHRQDPVGRARRHAHAARPSRRATRTPESLRRCSPASTSRWWRS